MGIKEKKEQEFLETRKSKLKVEKEVVKEEANIKNIKTKKTQEEKWNDDYDNFKSSVYFNKLKDIENVVYNNNGYISRENGAVITSNVKAFADSIGLITIDVDDYNNEKIILTDKGKYFMSKYLINIDNELRNNS